MRASLSIAVSPSDGDGEKEEGFRAGTDDMNAEKKPPDPCCDRLSSIWCSISKTLKHRFNTADANRSVSAPATGNSSASKTATSTRAASHEPNRFPNTEMDVVPGCVDVEDNAETTGWRSTASTHFMRCWATASSAREPANAHIHCSCVSSRWNPLLSCVEPSKCFHSYDEAVRGSVSRWWRLVE